MPLPPSQPQTLSPLPVIALPVGPAAACPATALPLQGMTILAVEDSRYACEALRLIARRAGARLRRAETLEAARAHLRTYRPDVAIVDLGLPDGRGEALIRDLVLARPRAGAILGMSGLPSGRASAMAAGADGFLDKPLGGYRAFCEVLAPFMPERMQISLDDLSAPLPASDPLALQDDLERAAEGLSQDPDTATRRYFAGFVAGIARVTEDAGLALATQGVALDNSGLDHLREMIRDRLTRQPLAMARRKD